MRFQRNRNVTGTAIFTIIFVINGYRMGLAWSSEITDSTSVVTGTLSTTPSLSISTRIFLRTQADERSSSPKAKMPSTTAFTSSQGRTQVSTPPTTFTKISHYSKRTGFSTSRTQQFSFSKERHTTVPSDLFTTKKVTAVETTASFSASRFGSSYTRKPELRTTPRGGIFTETSTLLPAELLIGSPYCNFLETCESSDATYKTFPERNCYCDLLCSAFNDCCDNFKPLANLTVKRSQFSCLLTETIKSHNDNGFYMVTSCSDTWQNDIIRSLCEKLDQDMLLQTPVTDKSEYRITYRNMYCAQCNFVYDFEYWMADVHCKDDTERVTSTCDVKHESPTNVPLRECIQDISTECLSREPAELINNCTNGPFTLVYTSYGVYRNKYCAACDGFKLQNMYCQMPAVKFRTTTHTIYTTGGPVYSFRLLVDLNAASNADKCGDSEIYDRVTGKCRQIYCAPPLTARKGACMVDTMEETTAMFVNNSSKPRYNCTLVKLSSEEYKWLNDSQILFLSRKVMLSVDDYHIIGSDVFICHDIFGNCGTGCKSSSIYFNYVAGESYISLIGLSVSIASLSLTFLVYVCFPKLLNIPGKNLTCLVTSLLFSHTLFLVSSEAEKNPTLCKLVAILLHYFFLAAFCWMNIIAFDFCTTFSSNLVSTDKSIKRFIIYSMYAWLTPMIFISIAVCLDLFDLDPKYSSLKPGYGKGFCWITSSDSLILFFAGPLVLLKLFDFIAFALTMVYIARAKRQGARATKKNNTCSFLINLKLSLIMGLTWVFAFVANVTQDMTIWYLYTIFNSLQGLFIAICFLCSRRVIRLITEKYRNVTSRFISSSASTKSELYI